jgi:hypothetical protein
MKQSWPRSKRTVPHSINGLTRKRLAGIEGWKGLRWLCGKQVAEARSCLCGDAGVSPQFTLVIYEIEKLGGCFRIA